MSNPLGVEPKHMKVTLHLYRNRRGKLKMFGVTPNDGHDSIQASRRKYQMQLSPLETRVLIEDLGVALAQMGEEMRLTTAEAIALWGGVKE